MPTSYSETVPRNMAAIRCHGPEDYRLEELPTPAPGPGEVLIEVEAAGICASDVKCFGGAPLFWGDADRKAYVQAPVTAGHEFVGKVVGLGEGAGDRHSLKLGDRAISEQIVPCRECRYCRMGKYWLCDVHDIYGFHLSVPGAWAQYMLFPAQSINYRVPDTIPVEDAALIEPLACSMHAVDRAQVGFGDVAVIAGAGTLGLGMVACARLRNPGTLVSVDRSDNRLDLARKLGADVTLNPDRDDVGARVREMTGGYGCDVYVEATGHPDAVNAGLQMIRKAGVFVEFSNFAREVTADWTIIGDAKELTIFGSHLGPGCYPVVIDFLSRGLLKPGGIVTHRIPLAEFAHGIEMVHDGVSSIKVLLIP